jgi:hypothetical protein
MSKAEVFKPRHNLKHSNVPVKSVERNSFQHPKILDKKLPLKQSSKSKAVDIDSLKQKRRLVQYEQRWR